MAFLNTTLLFLNVFNVNYLFQWSLSDSNVHSYMYVGELRLRQMAYQMRQIHISFAPIYV